MKWWSSANNDELRFSRSHKHKYCVHPPNCKTTIRVTFHCYIQHPIKKHYQITVTALHSYILYFHYKSLLVLINCAITVVSKVRGGGAIITMQLHSPIVITIYMYMYKQQTHKLIHVHLCLLHTENLIHI
jgi:hypothetical protein